MKPTANVKLQKTPTVKMKSKEARKKSKKTKTEKEKDKSPEIKKIKLDSVVDGINSAVNGTKNRIKRKAPETEIAKPSKMQVEKPIEPEFSRPTNIGKRRNSGPSKIPPKVKLPTYVNLKEPASSTSRRRISTRQSKEPSDAFESISTINSGTNSVERSFSTSNEALDKNSKMTMPSSMRNNLSCVFLQRDTVEQVINNEAKDHIDQHNLNQPGRMNKKKPGPSISRKRNSSVLISRDPSDASENISEMNIRSTVDKKSSSSSRSEVSNKKTTLTIQSSILYKPSSDLIPSDTIEQTITNKAKDDIVQQNPATEQFQNILATERIDLSEKMRILSNEIEDLDYDNDSDQDLPFSECSNNLNHDDGDKTLKGKKNPHGRKSVKKAISDKCTKNAEAPKLSPLASENVDSIESKINQPGRMNKKKPRQSISRKRNSSVLISRDPSDASENISEINIRSTVDKKSSSSSRSEVSNKKTTLTIQSSILYKPSSDLIPSDTIEQTITNKAKDDIVQQNPSTEQFQNILATERIDLSEKVRRLSNENEELDYDFDSDQDNTEAMSFSECSNNLNHDDVKLVQVWATSTSIDHKSTLPNDSLLKNLPLLECVIKTMTLK